MTQSSVSFKLMKFEHSYILAMDHGQKPHLLWYLYSIIYMGTRERNGRRHQHADGDCEWRVGDEEGTLGALVTVNKVTFMEKKEERFGKG